MLKGLIGKVIGFVTGTGWIGWAGGAVGAAVLSFGIYKAVAFIDHYFFFLPAENLRKEQALVTLGSAYDSQVQANRRQAYFHQAQLDGILHIADLERALDEGLDQLDRRLAALKASGSDCIPPDDFQDLVDEGRPKQ